MKSKGERKKILNYCKREIGIRKKEYKKKAEQLSFLLFQSSIKKQEKVCITMKIKGGQYIS